MMKPDRYPIRSRPSPLQAAMAFSAMLIAMVVIVIAGLWQIDEWVVLRIRHVGGG